MQVTVFVQHNQNIFLNKCTLSEIDLPITEQAWFNPTIEGRTSDKRLVIIIDSIFLSIFNKEMGLFFLSDGYFRIFTDKRYV